MIFPVLQWFLEDKIKITNVTIPKRIHFFSEVCQWKHKGGYFLRSTKELIK